MMLESEPARALRYDNSDLVHPENYDWNADWVVLFNGGFSKIQQDDVANWVGENVPGRWAVTPCGTIILETEDDAMVCYLRFK